ncbi:hypothetical protein VOLCADRAFT_96779 [Volvox carteri f. nagariensis]|uniref:Uncharacterized protein n=1 Tax=Volvox carteri f. nagariensis TaxID=3068 RepID=D8UB12_VOLCA|nr:uncharacterized protein VOLCADRAFT_96779 [Volvox carteri f. nagariensis]EFJ43088.1 hypothetical protein VOLCADRAFT_96779 [Volvox carteri f. nagariensis]|eukprot:XP_002955887.1 hypothetical protein VOLCADRAFT_96779 [Volvox carteri f. nagariensis]
MSTYPADLIGLLQCARKALRNAKSGHGAALVERICVTGSLSRGTYAAGCEATGLELFLNVDLQFSPHEVAKALDALTTSISSGSEFADGNFEIIEVKVADAECRGGLWACLHARRRCNLPEAVVAGANPGGGGGGSGQDEPASAPATAETATGSDTPLILQLFLSENMTSSVSARSAPQPNGCDNVELVPLGLNSADEHKACQQQHNLMVAAEQRLRREARYRMRHSRAGAAATASSPGGATGMPVPAAAWVAKAACGVTEARSVFWSRQPEAARRAAREAHELWRRAIDAAGKGEKGGGGRGGGSCSSGPAELWSDEVMLLLDVLVLHGYRQLHDQRAEPQQLDSGAGEAPTQELLPAAAAAPATAAGDGDVLALAFKILSTDYATSNGGSSNGGGMRVALQGGILSGEEESGAADAVAGAEGGSGAGNRERGLVVLDPCFPVLDIYAAACEVVGGGEGAGVGQKQLRQLAEAAAAMLSGAKGPRDASLKGAALGGAEKGDSGVTHA